MLLTWPMQDGGRNIVMPLSPAAWFRYGQGITVATGASQWDDQSGNGRHLKQATGTKQGLVQGDGSILFDGSDDFMKCDAFALTFPVSAYFLMNPITWTALDMVCDGDVNDRLTLRQSGVSPQMLCGTLSASFTGPDFPLGTYAVYSMIWNAASSSAQINSGAPVNGSVGAAPTDPGGFTLASYADGAARFMNARYKEVILFSAAHSAAQRAAVISYLSVVGGL